MVGLGGGEGGGLGAEARGGVGWVAGAKRLVATHLFFVISSLSLQMFPGIFPSIWRRRRVFFSPGSFRRAATPTASL